MIEENKDCKTWALWVVIVLLVAALAYQNTHRPAMIAKGPELGAPGTEYYNSELQMQGDETQGKIGVSIPASVAVQDGKVLIAIKNTGQQAFVPYTLVGGSEVYRASRVISPGEKVSAVVPVGGADRCVTYVEALSGEIFSVTTKLVR